MAYESDPSPRRAIPTSRGTSHARSSSPARDAQAYRRRVRTSRRQPTRRVNTQRHLPLFAILVLVGVVAIAVIGILAFRGCRHATNTPNAQTEDTSIRESPYDWSLLSKSDDGQISYVSGGTTLSRAGIDVSEHQEWIDWQAVKAGGFSFAFVRVGYRSSNTGTIFSDNYADYNLRTVPEVGLDLGVYFYSQATNVEEAQEEADFVIEKLNGIKPTYPVIFDFEPGNIDGERITGMTPEECTEVALAFCERIEEAGLSAMIYGNAAALSNFDTTQLASRGFWYAEYSSAPSTDLPISFWQYSETGSITGVDGTVDLDLDLRGVLAGEAEMQTTEDKAA